MADKSKKTYGLIIPKKPGHVPNKSAQSSTYNVFGSESDEEDSGKVAITSVKKYSGPSTVKRQTQMGIDKALQEDPTVYEYDSIYDDLQATKPQVGAKEKSTSEKKARYISGLLKAAEVKKKEDERRKERQVQKEREAEGEMFADKEKFVTSAYKQKMLEMAEAEEKEKREAVLENMLDVTKQKDISGFYRYLYRTTTGNEVQPESGTKESTEKQDQVKGSPTSSQLKSSPSSSSDSESSDEVQSEAKAKVEFSKPNRPRHGGKFRQHRSDSSSPEPDRSTSKRSVPTSRHDSHTTDRDRERHRESHYSQRKRRSSSRSPSEKRQKSESSWSNSSSRRRSRERRSRSRERRSRERIMEKLSRSVDKKHRESHSSQSKKKQRESSPTFADKKTNSSSPQDKQKVQVKQSSDKENITVSENIKNSSVSLDSDKDKKQTKEKLEPVDPKTKVYPHHNTPKDIAEARKRYLQRKIAKEMAA